jgi:two-component system, cell cycle response regulator DivK
MAAIPLHDNGTHRPPVALLVDPDADTRRLYAEFLKLSSCVIEESDDGRDALAKALSGRADVVVTDTRLPGINGFDLCLLLRHDDSTSAIPIVVVTGDAFAADVERAKSVGADAVLVKPCLPDTLLAEIRRLLELSAGHRERARATRAKMHDQVARSGRLVDRCNAASRRQMLRTAHARHDTTTPAVVPPALVCPVCDQPLQYVRSHIGGVNAHQPEQWDYFECAAGCGTFQYRGRTRKLRRV